MRSLSASRFTLRSRLAEDRLEPRLLQEDGEEASLQSRSLPPPSSAARIIFSEGGKQRSSVLPWFISHTQLAIPSKLIIQYPRIKILQRVPQTASVVPCLRSESFFFVLYRLAPRVLKTPLTTPTTCARAHT